MNTSTLSAAPAPSRTTTITPFGRTRGRAGVAPRVAAPVRSAEVPGGSPIRDPRGDLSMFHLWCDEVEPVISRGQWLGPLVPAIVSELASPHRVQRGARWPQAAPGGLQRAPHRPQVAVRRRALGVPRVDEATSATARRRGVRLTRRAHAVFLGFAVGAVALCSTLTIANDTSAPPVPSTEAVARAGESVESLAQRTAQGRDVQDLAQSIRTANDLARGELLRAGDVLIVPGSAR